MAENIYLDHNATTPLHPVLREHWNEAMQFWGNPSSIHWAGRKVKEVLREARRGLAELLQVSPLEIHFNGGASEGNSSILASLPLNPVDGKRKILVSAVEHACVQSAADALSMRGYEVVRIPVSRNGELDEKVFMEQLDPTVALVSIMKANNETGVIFPIQKWSKAVREVEAWFHCDAVQTLGKISFFPDSEGVDYATFSAHKFYGLKGVGFTFVRKGAPFQPLVHGGGQERGRRGGTENVVGIWALWKLLPYLQSFESQMRKVKFLRDEFENKLLTLFPDVKITGAGNERIGNTSSLMIPGINGENLMMALDLAGVAVSTGSACSSGTSEPSASLRAMGFSIQEAGTSLRVSLGWFTTDEEMNQFLQILKDIVVRQRAVREVSP